MRRLLAAYLGGGLSFPGLVNGLETDLVALDQFADAEWVSEIRSIWGSLEIIYAVCLDEERTTLTDQELQTVRETVDELRVMLTEYE